MDESSSLNLNLHGYREKAMDAYSAIQHLYGQLASTVAGILEMRLRSSGVSVVMIQQRVKQVESFGDKAVEPVPDDPSRLKYLNPLIDIQDLAGVRVVVLFIDDLKRVQEVIGDEFEVSAQENKQQSMPRDESYGYQSIHFVVSLPSRHEVLAQHPELSNLKAEIQLRTLLQHAWAEVVHDIEYKSKISGVMLDDTHRRLRELAGLLDIADREFQAIQRGSL